jgi:hypothetical protein
MLSMYKVQYEYVVSQVIWLSTLACMKLKIHRELYYSCLN